MFTCTGATQVLDHVVHDYNMDQHGDITLARAFRVSCNNAFAQAALMMGDTALRRTAESFGFNDNFLFRDLVVENSVYPTQNRNSVEIAWSGAGQSQVVATPMHMCMVAAAIANDGVMMEPRLLSLVESPAGKVRLRYSQKVYRTACSPEMAEIIDGYMKDVVKSGTGTRAQVERADHRGQDRQRGGVGQRRGCDARLVCGVHRQRPVSLCHQRAGGKRRQRRQRGRAGGPSGV